MTLSTKFDEAQGVCWNQYKAGEFVDIILLAERLTKYFGKEIFDAVIPTKLLEHVKDWRPAKLSDVALYSVI